jgi:hypothetical protein
MGSVKKTHPSLIISIAVVIVITLVGAFVVMKSKSSGPNVTIRGHRTALCNQAQAALRRCTSKRSHDMLKTCASDLERVHRECPK